VTDPKSAITRGSQALAEALAGAAAEPAESGRKLPFGFTSSR
jgi:hypothetical protein